MKKLLALLLALMMIFSFAACGGPTAAGNNEGTEPEDSATLKKAN